MSVTDYEIKNWPDDFTAVYTAGRDIVSIVTAGEIADKREQFGLAVYNVAGFAVGQVLGQPNLVVGADFSIDENCCPSEQLADELRPVVACASAGDAAKLKINWLKILGLALRILPLFLDKSK